MKNTTKGFTIIELVIVIAITAILAAISIVGFTSIQQGSRNTQRSSRITSVAEALEKYYMKNGEYPSCAMMTQSSATVVSTVLKGLDPVNLATPQATAGTNSFICDADPTSIQYGYFGGTTSYTLKYKEEGNTSVPVPLASRHHSIAPNYTLTLVADTSTGGSVTGGGVYSAGDNAPMSATPNQYYQLSPSNPWTGSSGCSAGGPTIIMNEPKTCIAHFTPTVIATPAVPTVTSDTVGATTTWSWGAASCPGNSARYQYRYTISPSGYDSGIIGIASTSVAFTTAPGGQTYTVAVQAECYNTATSSGMSSSGSASYVRPAAYYTLDLQACDQDGDYNCVSDSGWGTVSGGGSYVEGSTVQMTATSDPYPFGFDQWQGDSGCDGAASHMILMDSHKSCRAYFWVN